MCGVGAQKRRPQASWGAWVPTSGCLRQRESQAASCPGLPQEWQYSGPLSGCFNLFWLFCCFLRGPFARLPLAPVLLDKDRQAEGTLELPAGINK